MGRALERRWRLPLWGFTVASREIEGGPDRSKEEAEALARELVGALRAGRIGLAQAKAQHAPNAPGRPDGWVVLLTRREGAEEIFDALSAAPEGAWIDPIPTADGWTVISVRDDWATVF